MVALVRLGLARQAVNHRFLTFYIPPLRPNPHVCLIDVSPEFNKYSASYQTSNIHHFSVVSDMRGALLQFKSLALRQCE